MNAFFTKVHFQGPLSIAGKDGHYLRSNNQIKINK